MVVLTLEAANVCRYAQCTPLSRVNEAKSAHDKPATTQREWLCVWPRRFLLAA